MYKKNLEKSLIREFREAYNKGNFDEAMKYALDLDQKFYMQGIDLLKFYK
jgi:hypothetical protein